MKSYFILIIALLMNATANIFMKLGAKKSQIIEANGIMEKLLLFFNFLTILAIFLFAFNIIFYRKALESIRLSVAYPIMTGGGLLLVTLVSILHPSLKEKLSVSHIVGIVIIFIGVILVSKEI